MGKKNINDLMGAIAFGDINLVRQCLNDEVNLNATVKYGGQSVISYPLVHAFRYQQFEIFKLLFDETDGVAIIKKAYCVISNFLVERPLLKTYRETHDIYRWLLENNRYSKFGYTKLQIQVAFDDVAAVQEVLKNNQKNEFEKDAFGRSPFIFACSPEMLELMPSRFSYIDNKKYECVDKSHHHFFTQSRVTLPVMLSGRGDIVSLLLNYADKYANTDNKIDLNAGLPNQKLPYQESIAARLMAYGQFDILTYLMKQSPNTCINLNAVVSVNNNNDIKTIPVMLAQAKKIDLLEKLFASLKDSEFELLEVAPKGSDNLISLLKDSPSTLRKIMVKTSSESINRTFKLLMDIKDDGSLKALMECLRKIFDDRFSAYETENDVSEGGVQLFEQIYSAYEGLPEIAEYLSRKLECFKDLDKHPDSYRLSFTAIRKIFAPKLPTLCDLNKIRNAHLIDLVKVVLLATGAPNRDHLIMERFIGILESQASQQATTMERLAGIFEKQSSQNSILQPDFRSFQSKTNGDYRGNRVSTNVRQGVQEQNNNSLPSVGLFQPKTHGDYRDNKASTDDNNTKKTKLDDTQSPSFSKDGIG